MYVNEKDKVRAKKRLGQHFLKNEDIARRIAEAVTTPNASVLEIGPGMGVLTQFLLQQPFNDFSVIELDEESVAYLQEHFPQLGDNLIAAVAEYHQCNGKVESAIWGKGILPPEAERYFNTGTIVFNMEKCREERTWEKILDWYRAHYDIADRIEQDAWNALYWKRTKLLPLRWNFHDRLVKSYPKWDLKAKYWLGNPPRECLEAALKPAILHFWGPKKPWKTCHRPYRKLYHEAMRAVGQVPPKEPLLAPYYNLVNALNIRKIRNRVA